MNTSRRNFLKAAGLTVGCATLGGAGMVVAAPDRAPDTPDEYLESKKQVFESIYGADKTPEQIIDEAIETAPPRQLVEQNHRYNEGDALIPEIWAREALNILEESMVVGALVHRDFSPEAAQYGDVVNVHKPKEFKLTRRADDAPLRFDEPVIEKQRIVLEEHLYSQFVIKDGEYCRSFKDLVDMFVYPAMVSTARTLDMILVEKMMQTENQVYGHNVPDLMIDGRQKMNENRAFVNGRHAVIPTTWEADLLKSELLERHVDGNKLRFLGFDTVADVAANEGLAFHRDSTVLATRPLMIPPHYNGVRAAVAQYNDLSMRCVMQYDICQAGTRVTFDMLTGSSILDDSLLCRMNRTLPLGRSFLDTRLKTVALN